MGPEEAKCVQHHPCLASVYTRPRAATELDRGASELGCALSIKETSDFKDLVSEKSQTAY